MTALEFQTWLMRWHEAHAPSQPLIMGILNVTPDSFSDGGLFYSKDKALAKVMNMIDEGVDLIDIGGESTKPGAQSVSVDEELDRVIPVIESIRSRSDICLSLDTSKTEVMKAGISAGVNLINDVNALQADGALDYLVQVDTPVCLMHKRGEPASMQDNPVYKQGVVPEILQFFAQRLKACDNTGLDRQRVILDPGFGFGKTVHHNLQLLKSIEQFQQFDLPLLLGVSRKSTIGTVLDKASHERLAGGLAVAVYAVLKGVSIIRTHDVDETMQALKMIQAITTIQDSATQ